MSYVFDSSTNIHVLDDYFVSFLAERTVSGGYFVSVSGSNYKVAPTSVDTDYRAVGIAVESATSGVEVSVAVRGFVKVLLDSGDSLNPGDHFVATSGGYVRAITAPAYATYSGIWLDASGFVQTSSLVLSLLDLYADIGKAFTSGKATGVYGWIDIV